MSADSFLVFCFYSSSVGRTETRMGWDHGASSVHPGSELHKNQESLKMLEPIPGFQASGAIPRDKSSPRRPLTPGVTQWNKFFLTGYGKIHASHLNLAGCTYHKAQLPRAFPLWAVPTATTSVGLAGQEVLVFGRT